MSYRKLIDDAAAMLKSRDAKILEESTGLNDMSFEQLKEQLYNARLQQHNLQEGSAEKIANSKTIEQTLMQIEFRQLHESKEGILSKIAGKIMGAAPTTPKYKVGDHVEYNTDIHQPAWKDGGRGKGVITKYSNGHYTVNGNPVNHFDIKSHKPAVAEAKEHDDTEEDKKLIKKMVKPEALKEEEQLDEGTGIGDLVKLKKMVDGHRYAQVAGFVISKKDGKIHPNGMVSGTVTHFKVRLKKDPLATVNNNPVIHVERENAEKVNQDAEIQTHLRNQKWAASIGKSKNESVELTEEENDKIFKNLNRSRVQESEQLDELSRDTLGSYVKKKIDDKNKLNVSIASTMDSKRKRVYINARNKANEKINLAQGKIVDKTPVNKLDISGHATPSQVYPKNSIKD